MERNTYTPVLLKVSFQVRLKQRKPGKAWHHLVENQSERERESERARERERERERESLLCLKSFLQSLYLCDLGLVTRPRWISISSSVR